MTNSEYVKYEFHGGSSHLQLIESFENKLSHVERYIPKLKDEVDPDDFNIIKTIPIKDGNPYPNSSSSQVSIDPILSYNDDTTIKDFGMTYPFLNDTGQSFLPDTSKLGITIIDVTEDKQENQPILEFSNTSAYITLNFRANLNWINGTYTYNLRYKYICDHLKPEKVQEAKALFLILDELSKDHETNEEQIGSILAQLYTTDFYDRYTKTYDEYPITIALTIRDYIPAAKFGFPGWVALQREDGTMSDQVPKGEGPFECFYKVTLTASTIKGVINDDMITPKFQCNLYPEFYSHIGVFESSPTNGYGDGFSYTSPGPDDRVIMTWTVRFTIEDLTEDGSVELREKFTTVNDVPYYDSGNNQNTWKVQTLSWKLNDDGESFTIKIS